MNRDVETVLDAEMIAELQPPCTYKQFRNHSVVAGSECSHSAEFIHRLLCEGCGEVSVGFRCRAHVPGVNPVCYCVQCNTHSAQCHLLSIEALR